MRFVAPLLLPYDEMNALSDSYAGDKITIRLRGHSDSTSETEQWYGLGGLQIMARLVLIVHFNIYSRVGFREKSPKLDRVEL